MKRVLIGTIMDGKAGGIDRYILNLFYEVHGAEVQFDFYTNSIDPQLQKELQNQQATLFEVADLKHPFRQYADFKRIFQRQKYDVAYFNFSTALGFLGPMAAKKCGVPKIVIHSHTSGCDITNLYKRKLMTGLHKLCRQILYRYGTDFYACSTEAGNWLFPSKIVSGPRFQLVKNAIHVEDFTFNMQIRDTLRAELGLADSFVIGHVGNFVYQKNHDFLLKVFADFSKKEANSRLLLVGDGVLFEEMQRQAEALGIQDRVLFLGRRTDANRFMQAMDAFAFPSNFEGLGIVAIEAQAAGLPCVFSDRVPKETQITDLCIYLPIDTPDAVDQWIDALQKTKTRKRANTTAAIADAGYDIQMQDMKKLV